MSQKALLGVSNLLPSSLRELARIKGVGDKFLEKYGDTVLEFVREFRAETGADMDFPTPEVAVRPDAGGTKPKRKEREDTRLVTLGLLEEGLTRREIAAERGLSAATIDGHIADLIRRGALEADRFDAGRQDPGDYPLSERASRREIRIDPGKSRQRLFVQQRSVSCTVRSNGASSPPLRFPFLLSAASVLPLFRIKQRIMEQNYAREEVYNPETIEKLSEHYRAILELLGEDTRPRRVGQDARTDRQGDVFPDARLR